MCNSDIFDDDGQVLANVHLLGSAFQEKSETLKGHLLKRCAQLALLPLEIESSFVLFSVQ